MPQEQKPWTAAMEQFLQDGEWHTVVEIRAVGEQQVSAERALQEMKNKQPTASEEARVSTGKRNVASQALTGMKRFGKVEQRRNDQGVEEFRWVGNKSQNIGDLVKQVSKLDNQVRDLINLTEVLLSQVEWQQGGQAEGATKPDVDPRALYEEKFGQE